MDNKQKVEIKKLEIKTKHYDKILEKVADICPSAIQNGKIDFERLKAELVDVIDNNTYETYDFRWVGKNESILEANKPINKTLRPCKEESKNWDATQNLYIEGDNLEVLKLLEETYVKKIKMIYIDPPYNTGNDFVYHDNRTQSEEDLNQGIFLFDEEDNRLLTKSFVRNTESNGRFHSDWCSMMYPRLKLARDLLADDGVIFISIDDNEVANLKKICDEVFGEENFVGNINCLDNLKGKENDSYISYTSHYIISYIKKKAENGKFNLVDIKEKLENKYSKIDKNGNLYNLNSFKKTGSDKNRDDRPYMFYPILYKNQFFMISDDEYKKIYINGKFCDDEILKLKNKYISLGYQFILPIDNNNKYLRWISGFDSCKELIEKDELEYSNGSIYQKKYPKDIELIENSIYGTPKNFIYQKEFANGTIELNSLGLKFDNPKSKELMKYLIKLIENNQNAIILDFFSGSATTAHAVMELNAEDGGNRKFIMVQLQEETEEKSEAYKAGYKNICEIGKERIRRAGEKIVQETGKKDLDIGFRVLKVDESNMQDVYYRPIETKQEDLLNKVENIKPDRTALDLLFGVMVEWGVELSLSLKEIKNNANTIYVVGDSDLVACFDKEVDDDTITKMAELMPTRVIFRDSCFDVDDKKINMFEIFKTICNWDDKQAMDNVRVI